MKVYQKLFAYVERQKYLAYVAICISALSAFLTLYGYYFIYRFLESAIVYGQIGQAQSHALTSVLALTLSAVLYMISTLCSHLVGFRLETQLRKRGIDGLARASFRFFDLNPSGAVRKLIDDNASQTHMIVAHLIPDNSQAILGPIFCLVLGFMVSLRVGLILLALSLVAGLVLKAMMGDQEFMKKYHEALARLSAETVEYVRGIQVVKIFGTKLQSFKSLYQAIQDYSREALNYSNSCKGPYVWYQWLFLGLAAIVIMPAVLYLDRLGDPNRLILDLVMLVFLSGVLFVSFMRIMWVGMYVFQANYAVDNLEKIYQEMQADQLNFGSLDRVENYEIEFDRVSFAYNQTPVLSDLSFKLEAGKSYALVGRSGSGKSTIAKLISGFYKLDGGQIKIGGRPMEDYSQKAICQAISFVFQDPKLFKKTIYENVALAKPQAGKDQVMAALSAAGCDSILAKFPRAEQTLIGSKGVYLSGGEKQRIAIARAILKDSPIIIMDEASAAIDPENEHELQKAFKNLIEGKTVIMIAHRLSSIRAVDQILVLEKGQIIERGSDRELLAKDSVYKSLQDLYKQANQWRLGYEEVLSK